MKAMQVYVRGGSANPKKVSVSRDRPIWRLLNAELPKLKPTTPILIQAGTGAGKTTAVLDSIVSFAIAQGLPVWFVSSRAAINSQVKLRLATKLGIDAVHTDYTTEGLRHLEDIGPVKIMTYHRLWNLLNSDFASVKDVGILVFDEIHALALDATFIPFTGTLLAQIPKAFAGAIRIYMTATSKPILPALIRAEGHQAITIYKWPVSYQHFRLHFWSKLQDLIGFFDKLPRGERALIFVPSIAEGLILQKKLGLESRLVTAQTKRENPELWAELLETGHLGCPILLATTALDAGVSLLDPALKHVVCYGIDPAAVIQQAGRKRAKVGERVSLYLFSPSRKQLGHLYQKDKEALASLLLNNENPHRFLRECVLEDTFPQARRMCTVTQNATIEVNPLAIAHYKRELTQIERLLRSKTEYPMETCWQRLFRLASLKGRLDNRNKEEAEKTLREFLNNHLGRILEEEERDPFAQTLQQLYTSAFGNRKNDRSDRSWRLTTCRKVLASLNWGFTIDSVGQTWVLRNQGGESHG